MTRRALILALAAPAGREETLFDGRSFRNFRTPTQATGPEVSWVIRGEALETVADARRQCDLWTSQEYTRFDLEFEWKVDPGANTGIKYLIQASATDRLRDARGEFLHETSLGFEFQLVDDASGAGADRPEHASGALYNYLAPGERPARPAGEWNSGRLVVGEDEVEHWLNGRRVLRFGLRSAELKAALAARRVNSARMLERLERRKSPIAFQHHESHVAFRRLRVRSL